MSEQLITVIITAIASVLSGGAVVGWLKDRKKDNATVLLTNVEALQKQVLLLTTVTDYLRKENTQLAIDRDTEQERSRKLRERLSEVEDELAVVQRTANDAQSQVAALSEKVRRLVLGEEQP